MAPMTPEAALEKMSAWMSQLYGERLQSLLVYGSAANSSHHRSQRSDINLLAVLDHLDAATLDQGAEAVRWWTAQGNPPLIMLSRDEQDEAADVFPIEYLDIQANHRVLMGRDPFAEVPHFPDLHRLQVEHELRAKLLRLRGGYMALGNDAKSLEAMLLDSASTFLTLFRHALVAQGEPFIATKDEVLAAASRHFGFPAEAFALVLAARRSGARLEGGKLEPLRALFARYLASIHTVERSLENHHA